MTARINSNELTFKDNVFIGELSQFNDKHFAIISKTQHGFEIVSEKTGNVAVFALTKYDYDDRENELIAVRFVCITPGITHLKATLFND